MSLLMVAAIDPAWGEQQCHHARVLEHKSTTEALALIDGHVVRLDIQGATSGEILIVKSNTRLISKELSYQPISSPSECRL